MAVIVVLEARKSRIFKISCLSKASKTNSNNLVEGQVKNFSDDPYREQDDSLLAESADGNK